MKTSLAPDVRAWLVADAVPVTYGNRRRVAAGVVVVAFVVVLTAIGEAARRNGDGDGA